MKGGQDSFFHWAGHSSCLEHTAEHQPHPVNLGAARHVEQVRKCLHPGPLGDTLNICYKERGRERGEERGREGRERGKRGRERGEKRGREGREEEREKKGSGKEIVTMYSLPLEIKSKTNKQSGG